MYNPNDLKPFTFDIELVFDALKLQDKALLQSLEYFFTTLLGSEYTKDILTAAMFQIAESDSEACRWALRNFYDLKLHRDVKEAVVRFAVQKLIGKGFILGQDFSVTPNSGIVINKNAKAALLEVTSASEHLFLEEILQVFDEQRSQKSEKGQEEERFMPQ